MEYLEWIVSHWELIIGIAGTVVMSASAIAKGLKMLTGLTYWTEADDIFINRVIAFLDSIALNSEPIVINKPKIPPVV